MDEKELNEIYIKDQIAWTDFYVDDAHYHIKILKKEIQKYQNRILELTEKKQGLNEKLNNSLHKK